MRHANTTHVAPICAHGFTLIELMVAVAVAAILAAIVVPSFHKLTISNTLAAVADDVVGAINLARMEAVKRNANAQFCSDVASTNTSDTLGAACGTQSGAVYVWATGNPATVQVRAATASLQPPVQLHNHIAAVRFNGQGLGYAAGTTGSPYSGMVADICSAAISRDNHRVVAMATGSIITTTTTTGACP